MAHLHDTAGGCIATATSCRLTTPASLQFTTAHQAPAAPALALLRHGLAGAIPLPLLAGPALDLWLGAGAFSSGQIGPVHWRRMGDAAFLHYTLPDADWRRHPAAAAEEVYRALEMARAALGVPHWWRFWNYLGGIVEGKGDAEHYRQFTLGRHRAWEAAGLLSAPLPAATAIGCTSGLHVFALAGRSAPVPIENPRQVNAWRYPREYGEKPPSFVRAALLREGDIGWLFVSGTASIVGHESRHVGDARAQLDEARANLDAVLAAAAQHAGLPQSALRPRNFKLYWSSPEDAASHADATALFAALAPTQVLHGTVCRRELAVEIEALYALDARA